MTDAQRPTETVLSMKEPLSIDPMSRIHENRVKRFISPAQIKVLEVGSWPFERF